MGHRRRAIDGLQAFERHGEPLPIALLPVERRVPSIAVDRRPAIGKPQRGGAVASVLHEREPFAVRDETVGQAEGMDEDVVTRCFVVPGKTFAVVACLANAAGIIDPAWFAWLGRSRAGPGVAVSGPERVGGEQRKNIRQQQLLMLLLVVDADLDQPRYLRLRLDAQGKKLDQPLVHVRAIGHDPFTRGSRQHASLGARLPRPLAFIIRVEAVVEGVVEGAVMRQVFGENECLKKPGDVGEVPFAGACVFHGLDCHVLGAERRRKLVRQAAHIKQPVFEHAAAFDRRSLNG